MSNHQTQTKVCNCQIPSNEKIFHSHTYHSFCEKCGSIMIKSVNGHIYYTIKPTKMQKGTEFNPISFIKSMKAKTEENYPFIYNLYNHPNLYHFDEGDKNLSIYLRNRKMLILKLQKLIKTFDYCDMIFYQCLFYLDTYLRRDISEEMSKKTLLYNLVGYFLCSAKLRENDIFEPTLDTFFNLSNGIYLAPSKIIQYEELCLRNINYNIFSYSSYDWITQLISNGIIFNSEIDENNEIVVIKGHKHSLVNIINKYAIKLLLHLTSKECFFKYSPMYIAFSIIQLSREKYIDPSMIKPKLFHKLIHLYGVDHSNFQNCYEELKAELNTDENKNNSKEHESNSDENTKNETKYNNLRRVSVDKVQKSFKSFVKKKKMYMPTEIVNNIDNNGYNTKITNIQKDNNEHHRTRNKISLTKIKHLSIDCGTSSKTRLPIINSKYQNIRNESNLINYNDISSNKKENENNSKKDSFKENKEDNHENHISKTRKKLLTSKNLIKINFNEKLNSIHNNLEQNKEEEHEHGHNRRKYKLKSSKNVGVNELLL